MSFRPLVREEANRARGGSLFGAALEFPTSSLSRSTSWPMPMAVSPLSAPSETGNSEIPEFSLDSCSFSPPHALASEGGPCAAEGMVHTWGHNEDEWFEASFAYFERKADPVVLSHTASGPRLNESPVLPRLVVADSVVWGPLTGPCGEEGHGFTLSKAGAVVSTIEAYASSHRPATRAEGRRPPLLLDRVLVVDATYSPLSMEAGTCDKSALLEYRNLESYLSSLDSLLQKLRAGDGTFLYAPVSEIRIGRILERMPLRISDRNHALSGEAFAAWSSVKAFFSRMRPLVEEAINNHNRNEIERCKASELASLNTESWCRF